MRVAVVGAGAAGVSAAIYLQKRGHDVVVYEASDRVGGKCLSVPLDDAVYDMGAVVLTDASKNTRELLSGLELEKLRVPRRGMVSEAGFHSIMKKILAEHSVWAVAWAVLSYIWLLIRFRSVRRPGFRDVPKHLCVPFGEVLTRIHAEPLRDFFMAPVSGYGYGRLDQVPAIYVLKYIHLGLLAVILREMLGSRSSYRVKQGIGRLWEQLAAELEIRLGQPISAIETRRGGVTVATAAGREAFDRIVLAIPPSEIARIDGLNPDLLRLLAKSKTHNYATILFRSDRSLDRLVFQLPLPDDGAPFLLAFSDADAAISYTYCGQRDCSDAALIASLEGSLRPLGVTSKEVVRIERWRYAPYFDRADIANGVYDQLEALQGLDGVYLCGSLCAFETVEHVVSYSKHLVATRF